MLTFIGYSLPAVLFAIGAVGVATGWLPFFTRTARRDVRTFLAVVLLCTPLPLAVWLAGLTPESDEVRAEARRLHAMQTDLLERSDKLNRELLEKYKVAGGPAAEAEAIAGATEYDEYDRPLKEHRDRLAATFDELNAYKLMFDRLFFAFVAAVLAIAVLPMQSQLGDTRPPRGG